MKRGPIGETWRVGRGASVRGEEEAGHRGGIYLGRGGCIGPPARVGWVEEMTDSGLPVTAKATC